MDLFLEILDAHGEAIETHATKSFEVGAGSDARIDLDTDFGIKGEREALARVGEKIVDLFGREISRGAAAPMELRYGTIAANTTRDTIDFLFESGEIGRSDALIFLNDDVARAEEAEAFAERKMHVERDGRAFGVGVFDGGFKIAGAERVNPDRSGGIAGVARAGAIVAIDEVFADGEFLLHLVEGGVGGGHGCLRRRVVLVTALGSGWAIL